MGFKSDIEIAQETPMLHIREIAKTAGVDEKYLEQYGNYKAKVDYNILKDMADKPNGKLVLVTAINPTPAGEGKTTTTVGLADAMRRIGKNVMVALREPSSAPCSASRAALPAAATHRSSPWRTSTCTSPVTSTPSALPTTCWLRCSITISIRAMLWALTPVRSPGAAASI